MESIHGFFNDVLQQAGIPESIAIPIKGFLFVLMLVLLCILVNWIAKLLIVKIIGRVIRRSKNRWDDVILEKKVFRRLSHLAPVMVIYWAGPAFMAEFPNLVKFTYLAANVYIVFIVLIILYALLDVVGSIYASHDISKSRPIKGYLQVTKIIGGLIAGILILSIILDKSPVYFFTGLGAITAILILVFRDTILGFVAGIQVTTNNMVQIGDWVEMPKYGADGDVIDISLHTVKIQNFDRTITTIPTYALVSDSFKNWRGMVMTGGRRIMREVYIDINSIKFCDEEMLQKFSKIKILREYIEQKREEIQKYNKEYNIDPEVPVNGRRMTNIGTFRAYITRYLDRHPNIHTGLISMVRQMPSGEKGVPLQIYAFTNNTNWTVYESIQADIFDHILSVVSYFDLKIFQFPTELTLKLPDFEQLKNPKDQ